MTTKKQREAEREGEERSIILFLILMMSSLLIRRSHPLSVRAGKDFAEVVEVLSCNEQCAEVAEKRRLEKEAAALAANKNQPTKVKREMRF